MLRVSCQSIASFGTALAVALLSLTVANAQSTSNNTPPRNWDEVFAQAARDQTAVWKQSDWPDTSVLGYAKPPRSDVASAPWAPPQQMPAVDGINAKVDGYGGGANHSNGFYGGNGSLSLPVAQQWGLQVDGGVGSEKGVGAEGGAGHLFWRELARGFRTLLRGDSIPEEVSDGKACPSQPGVQARSGSPA